MLKWTYDNKISLIAYVTMLSVIISEGGVQYGNIHIFYYFCHSKYSKLLCMQMVR